ncbi:PRANC domain-containing protein [Wolbachia endosymbiont of Pentidionis agamae]|uniref:PRANC domain-containing protein n=1 Tax=Wolbachia endosymbiont of Pentidionis agamae TaxID=3110435 RepID=UPI002FCFD331
MENSQEAEKIRSNSSFFSKNVCSSNTSVINSLVYGLKKYCDYCVSELEKMRDERISGNSISYYEFFKINIEESAKVIRNLDFYKNDIAKTLGSGEYKKKFPMYQANIKEKFDVAYERNSLLCQIRLTAAKFLEPKNKRLTTSWQDLPEEAQEKILDEFNNDKLKDYVKKLSQPNTQVENPEVVSISAIPSHSL